MDYTKGEWKFNRLNDLGIEGSQYPICHVFQNFAPDEVSANAQLISAAPDMYEALRKVRENIGHIIMTKADAILVDQIDKALRKAEGLK